MKLTCASIDDEPLAASLLESYALKTPFLELKGKYNSALNAMDALHNEPVQVLFLDIQMPELSGMEFSKMLPPETKVIFTTAFEQYAVDSYRVNALDYLLKPISYSDFLKAAQKACDWFESHQRKTEEPVTGTDNENEDLSRRRSSSYSFPDQYENGRRYASVEPFHPCTPFIHCPAGED